MQFFQLRNFSVLPDDGQGAGKWLLALALHSSGAGLKRAGDFLSFAFSLSLQRAGAALL